MISKLKLLNGYIDNKNKELQKEWYKACKHYGFDMKYCDGCFDGSDFSYIAENKAHYCSKAFTDSFISGKNQLTLSDFKPKKTRTEWVKVEDSIFDLREEFECGELYNKKGGEYVTFETVMQLANSLAHGNCYRKVEKEIYWPTEVAKHVNSLPDKPDDLDCGHWNFAGKVITDENLIHICHLVAELTEKPE